MGSLPSRAPTAVGTAMHSLKWSPSEKVIARKAFSVALEREFQALILEAKGKAARIEEPSGLWDLEQYLTERRREIDRVYDYRYSVLPLVFAELLRNGRVLEGELHGLGEDKLSWIRRCSSTF
jgi:Photoprotection regulator fluorescence recovery protein